MSRVHMWFTSAEVARLKELTQAARAALRAGDHKLAKFAERLLQEIENAERTPLRQSVVPMLQRLIDTAATERKLSPRETQVFHLMLDGAEYVQIGASLSIAERTVNVHANSIFRKFGLHRREQLFATIFARK